MKFLYLKQAAFLREQLSHVVAHQLINDFLRHAASAQFRQHALRNVQHPANGAWVFARIRLPGSPVVGVKRIVMRENDPILPAALEQFKQRFNPLFGRIKAVMPETIQPDIRPVSQDSRQIVQIVAVAAMADHDALRRRPAKQPAAPARFSR